MSELAEGQFSQGSLGFDEEGGYWAICLEIPGANGQGETNEETGNSLREAIQLVFEDRKADILRLSGRTKS
jgi:predicted RNase H-like HicB family nuclease